MEWGIIITGFYLMGLVGLMMGSINTDPTPNAQSGQSTQPHDELKQAA